MPGADEYEQIPQPSEDPNAAEKRERIERDIDRITGRLAEEAKAGQQPPPQQEQGLSPLAQALANDDPMGALQALETDGVIGEIDPDDANLMLPICTAVAELLRHQEQQTMARVVGVLDEELKRRNQGKVANRQRPDSVYQFYHGGVQALKRLQDRLQRQRLGGGTGDAPDPD